jgi:ppGpp synthetase/RelA/SpoT-type nucleotidyltranferase
MSRLTKKAIQFLHDYEKEFDEYRAAASTVERHIESLVIDARREIHLVAARAKTLDSLRSKLRRKGYSNPRDQITDLIGVRVITYYKDDVDPVVSLLKSALRIDQKNSTDKRKMLDLRSFGYRSVHLIAYLETTKMRHLPEGFRGKRFEIQVRSLLEHAWAEIEHEIVYKSGINHSNVVLRSFAALAGTLELLDSEFGDLRQRRNTLVDVHRDRYGRGLDGRRHLDAARLIAILEVHAPDALGWRSTARSFPPRSEAVCSEALKWVGIRSGDDLSRVIASAAFRRLRKDFAAGNGIAPAEVSHLALAVLAVAVLDRQVLAVVFPEMVRDPSLSSYLG